MQSLEKWILDTDCGIDDAQAVFIAIKHLNLVAITTVSGNTSALHAAKNVSIILGIKGNKTPIYIGSEHPILNNPNHIGNIHGHDGFGGMQEKFIQYADESLIKQENGVLALMRHINEEHSLGNKVCLAFIGPVTNLALAIRLDATIPSKIHKFYLMGGTYKGWGNMSLTGEFNLWTDPEASRIVYESMPYIYLLPWEVADDFVVTKED